MVWMSNFAGKSVTAARGQGRTQADRRRSADDLDNGDFATKYELLLAGLQSPAFGAHDWSRALSEHAPQERSEYDIRISAVLGELQCAYEHLSMREWDENQFRRVFA